MDIGQDFKIHGGWGDSIEWSDIEQFNKNANETTLFGVVGWLPDIPKIGQTLYGEFVNSHRLFKFVSIERQLDPRDMFFGKVRCIKSIDKRSGTVINYPTRTIRGLLNLKRSISQWLNYR